MIALVLFELAEVDPVWQMALIVTLPGALVWWNERRIGRRGDRSASRLMIPVDPTVAARDLDASYASFEPTAESQGDFSHETQVATTEKAMPAVALACSRENRREGWVASTNSATVQGRDIGGMVYVGVAPSVTNHGRRQACRAYIDPSLSVARKPKKPNEQVPSWPSYSVISAQQRATYLDWLQGGRVSTDIDVGYVLLYFFGLERRFIVDDACSSEAHAILHETTRLQDLYADSALIQRNLRAFIELARVQLHPLLDAPLPLERPQDEVSLSLRIAIGLRASRNEPIAANWLLAWFLSHPEKRLRTPATRCENEFKSTFIAFFDQRFPTGLKISKPGKTLTIVYRAASGEFDNTFTPKVEGQNVADISGLRKPIEIAQEIADEAMAALDRYSRLCGRDPAAARTLQGHLLLPSTIRAKFSCADRAALEEWSRKRIEANGLVPVLDVIERVTGDRLDKVGKRDLVDTADLLARIGIGMAPDPRFALRRPKTEEPVVLFDLGIEVDALQTVSTAFSSALLELALGALIAHADGHVHDREKSHLVARVSAAELPNETERLRLAANLTWLLDVPPDMASLRRHMKEASPEQIETLRVALVKSARADGTIVPTEVASLEKVYRALELEPALVYSDLHVIEKIDGLVTVRESELAACGEPVTGEEVAVSKGLDLARIAAIRSDTERVSSVLESIFEEAAEETPQATVQTSEDGQLGLLRGLDPAHSELAQALIERDHWNESDFEKLCQDKGLMVGGALETLNEWSYEVYQEALIDAYHGYDIAPEIAAQLREPPESS